MRTILIILNFEFLVSKHDDRGNTGLICSFIAHIFFQELKPRHAWQSQSIYGEDHQTVVR